jgi:predicted nuclease with TOPRIM domain
VIVFLEEKNMIHYSCDRCKCELNPAQDLRYIVRIEVEAAIEELASDVSDDPDRLEELEDLLESSDDYCSSELGNELFQRKRYDLCAGCYRQYMKNPLGREASSPFGFREN